MPQNYVGRCEVHHLQLRHVPYIGGQLEECSLHWWPMGRMLLISVVGGKKVHTLVANGQNVSYISDRWEDGPYSYSFQLERSCHCPQNHAGRGEVNQLQLRNVPYIGGQREESSLHWWPIWRKLLTLVANGKNTPDISGLWEECSLHWWPIWRLLLTLEANGKSDLYIGGQWEDCS